MARPPKLDQHLETWIVEKVQNKETWNAATASDLLLQKRGVTITSQQIRNVLHKANLKAVRRVLTQRWNQLIRNAAETKLSSIVAKKSVQLFLQL